ncbi:hypothetical protein K438DRAFT_1783808 [Mycena galopus ATCC 62051]|nr:hypothetical protein K438DRAFT_1783808 [Mycena galopus ATCC 62051]
MDVGQMQIFLLAVQHGNERAIAKVSASKIQTRMLETRSVTTYKEFVQYLQASFEIMRDIRQCAKSRGNSDVHIGEHASSKQNANVLHPQDAFMTNPQLLEIHPTNPLLRSTRMSRVTLRNLYEDFRSGKSQFSIFLAQKGSNRLQDFNFGTNIGEIAACPERPCHWQQGELALAGHLVRPKIFNARPGIIFTRLGQFFKAALYDCFAFALLDRDSSAYPKNGRLKFYKESRKLEPPPHASVPKHKFCINSSSCPLQAVDEAPLGLIPRRGAN